MTAFELIDAFSDGRTDQPTNLNARTLTDCNWKCFALEQSPAFIVLLKFGATAQHSTAQKQMEREKELDIAHSEHEIVCGL